MGWEGGGCDVHGLGRGGGWVYKELGGGEGGFTLLEMQQ